MLIDEAIEIIKKDIENPGSVPIELVNEAEKLSIEVLKAWKSSRDFSGINHFPLLAGETEQQ